VTYHTPWNIDTTPAPAWVRNAGKPWKPPRLSATGTPFEPKPFEIGDTVTWHDRETGEDRTGQVWSHHTYPKTRWVVADGIAYKVHERDLIVAPSNDQQLV
jgi:hypothetical protein